MAGPLVLIADDNEMNRRLARDVLGFAGFRTIEAETGGAALDLASAQQPDVILLDVRLPDMDGTAAVAELRRRSETASIPIVAVTAFAMIGDRERFLSAGFDGYLAKPIDVRDFPAQVKSFCRTTEAD